MIAILSPLAPLFLITAIGYALAAMKFGGGEMWHSLDHMTFYVFFPALLVKTLMRADLGSVPARGLVFVSFGSVTIVSGALLAALTELPMAFWDERLSTAAAERALLEADASRKRRAELIDKMAAAYILQGALDRLNYGLRSETP